MLRTALRPRFLGLLALMVAATLVCGLLATWQWDRAHRAITSRSEPTDPAVALEDALLLGEPVTNERAGDPVVARGTFDPAEQILVPGRRIDGQEAVIVVSALHVVQPDGGEARLPVARGWMPAADATGPDGEVDPALAPAVPAGEIEVTGLLEASEAATDGVSGHVAQEIATPLLVNEWGEPMYSGYLAQTSAADGLSPMPAAQSAFSRGLDWQNIGYAAQWVLFGGFFLYLWWRSVRTAYLDQRADERARLEASLQPADGPAAPGPTASAPTASDPAASGPAASDPDALAPTPQNPNDPKDVTGVDPDSATTR
ncbi:SURF1 family protein [Brachybacterium phenoliresistens]|uniref:SURF1-like protein n=1 Tax=Brachybacterium phenoliresistens TaxID=396014 RepID=Z9JUL9_9MICO|nr:SURF1 family cytochrome oxidase biogenesis protein [Brachybacterium phenoliresistens]EWS81904.1 hypothetical protein BF93_13825 [Brachybacterium phenoliresistens]